MAEHLAVMLQTRRDLAVLGRVARQDLVAANEAALDFIQPHLSPKLGGDVELAFTDNGRIGLKEADQLLFRRDAVAL